MRLAGILSASAVLLPLLLVLGAPPPFHGAASHNITDILVAHPDFSEFSAALTSTGAAADINNQGTITVLALDNSVMAQLKAQHLQPRDLQHVMYLHGLLDYLDATKLGSIRDGSAQVTSLYQATGKAQTNEGMVNITVFRGGRVEFALSTANTSTVPPPPAAIYQKSIKEVPYGFAILQVSAPIWSPAPVPGAPAPPPSSPGHGTAPASSPAHAPPPAPAPASSPAQAPPPAPAAPASSPAQAPTSPTIAPAIPPTPTPRRRHPAPPQEADTPADSPDAADSDPPADQKNNGARDTASWSLGMAVAAAVPVILLLLW